MDRFRKRGATAKACVVAAVLVSLLLVATAVSLPLLIDVNQYRGLIQSRAEATLGRKVTLGEMSLSLLPTFGIEIQNPEIQDLLSARSLTVGVRLLPLLFGGAIDVRRVVLESPEIAIARGPDGVWSFEGILSGGKPPADPATAGEAVKPGSRPGRPFSLSHLKIADGRIHLRDEHGRPSSPLALDLELDLEAAVSGSGEGDLRSAFDGELKGKDLLFDLRGSLAKDPPVTTFDIIVDQADIDVARAREVAAAAGRPLPVPEGLVRSDRLKMGGRLEGEFVHDAATRLSLTDVVVQDADLSLSRDRQGRWNLEALLGEARDEVGGGGAAEGPRLRIVNMRLAGGTVALHDEGAGAGPVDLAFEDVDLVVEELAEDRPLAIQLEAGVKPGSGWIKVSGTVPASFEDRAGAAPRAQAVDAEIHLQGIQAKAIAPYLLSLLDLSAESGDISLRCSVKGSYPQRVSASGSITLEDLKTLAATEPITARADFNVTAAEAAERIEIERLEAAFRRSRIGLRGTLRKKGESTLADLEIPPASIDASDLGAMLALAGLGHEMEFSAGRPVQMQARVRGDIKGKAELDVSGSLEVWEFSFRHPMMRNPMEQVRGRVALRSGGFDVTGFSGVIGRSDVSGTMSVTDLDAPRVTFGLSSRRADFWELMSFLKSDEEAPGRPGGGDRTARQGDEDYLGRISARGTLAIAEGSFDTLAFADLTSTLALDDKVVRLDPVSMKLYSGSMSGSATMDMNRDPAIYSVKAWANGIDTNGLLAANLEMKDALAGALSGDLSVTAWGATREAVLRNARGGGDLRIEKGRVGAINVLEVLSRASGLMGERSLTQVSDRLAKEGTEFSLMTAMLRVGGGKVSSTNLTLAAPDLELRDDGELDLLAGTIDIAGQVIFSEQLSQAMVQEKSKAVDYFWDAQRGRVSLPLTLAGPIGSLKPNIDWGTAGGRLARRKVEDKVRERLEEAGLGGLLGDRSGRLPGGDGEPAAKRLPIMAPPATGDLEVAIEEKGFSGNLLLPDLKIKGSLRGTDITAASVRISDEQGKLLHEESLQGKINKYYATHARSTPASIRFRVSLEGMKLGVARGDLQVSMTLQDAGGGRVTHDFTVSR